MLERGAFSVRTCAISYEKEHSVSPAHQAAALGLDIFYQWATLQPRGEHWPWDPSPATQKDTFWFGTAFVSQ